MYHNVVNIHDKDNIKNIMRTISTRIYLRNKLMIFKIAIPPNLVIVDCKDTSEEIFSIETS